MLQFQVASRIDVPNWKERWLAAIMDRNC
jgi:hypothetical protein